MWNGTKVLNWIFSLTTQNLLVAFKISVGASSILYGYFFGYPVAVLFLSSCLVAFKLPVLIVYFNQLLLGAERTNLPEIKQKHKFRTKPSSPYFLVDGGTISCDVNEALERFLDGILEKFVIHWHSALDVKEDEFVNEVRHIIKFMVVRLHQLLDEIDFPKLLINKIIPAFLWHLECFSTGLERSHSIEIEKYVLQCFGENLHPAISSRQTEEVYLKHCSEQILKDLLPNEIKSSKLLSILVRDILSCQVLQHAMDALANPENINRLTIVCLDEYSTVLLGSQTVESDPGVQILNNFTNNCQPNTKDLCLYPSLSSILKTPPHLYQLMQFLKRINTLKYLQFCFAVDEFNEKLLNPDLKPEQMKRLQLMGQKMFAMYFCHSSPDCIGFENESKNQMKSIVYASATEIVRLRTSSTLFQAYDYVMDILETKILPRFYRSPEFYQLVTDAQQSGGSSKSTKKKEAVSTGWGKKLRAALRPNWLAADAKLASLEPEDENYDTGIDLTEADFIADDVDADDRGAYADLIPVSGRDLTAWKTSIPRVVSAVDSAGKAIWGFEVEIQRGDIRPEDDPEEYHWTVIRTYLEFFHLESKLTEFHGEFVTNRLPPKKMFGTRSMAFLESVRVEFETFLRTLLHQPALKGSDLIFSFLTLSDLSACQAVGDSSVIGSNLLPDLGFSRMMRNVRHVPMKLRKEKGQDLDSFLQTFIASTEAPKPKPSKVEVRDISGEVSLPVIKELHPVFKDNAKSFLSQDGLSSRGTASRAVCIPTICSPYDCVLFAALKIWRVPQLLWSVLVGLRSLLSVYFDAYARNYFRAKFYSVIQPAKVTLAIKLLHETVLNQSSSESSNKVEYRQAAWKSIVKSIPSWMKNIFGVHAIENRCDLIFQCLQFPVLNKQISYVVLDIVLNETFPEIFSNDATDPSSP
ncbi:sorting nexin-14-like isoform X1 [Daphnia pulex]|uniref:sorting nexin-14-like isoform X1 n=2 Tax=Daphnia pulex TaxID=6669 RepID=UPI001EDEA8C7|nr:sorting nexin-14-like isoform X1 [Daphnia pulex]